ncbi:hypothetical protein DBR32_02890 [Taibaiella sp. KBW10]|uniref:hypothetical protein n=1 Tax=Taibaiella sp. KBW10 TaxID=2153357 RepID=UPI000F5A1503|nr:hypothetical protein [Taibaiella sp. KBW10]RQO32558.1 hypothetical protein DBR32_02890 [Taibaiella sp. KBW10]
MDETLEIYKIDSTIKYWFIRSDGGQNFETYLENDFIAIGWNDITLHDLTQIPAEQAKQKIANVYNLPLDQRSNRNSVTRIYNKLHNFVNLKKGDIFFIPSENSSRLAFGEILTNHVEVSENVIGNCSHYKRRAVKWLTDALPITSLDPTFFKIRKPWHAISEISTDYQYYIDSIIHDLYQKEDSTHFVLRVTQQNEINLVGLSKALTNLVDIMRLVNEQLSLGENIDESTIRINLQSPGLFNIKFSGSALALAACLLGATGCKEKQTPQVQQQIDNIYTQNKQHIDSSKQEIVGMGINL